MDWLKVVLWAIYWIGNVGTFIKLTFFDDYHYNWWNWMIALPVNEFLSGIWPLYWAVLRPLFS